MPGAYHRIRFARVDGNGFVEVDTTRPELLPACVALVAHPDDERYQPLFGREVTTPLFGVRVPVKAHALADPSKGTGIAMICTFGDTTDVTWWRELALHVRAIIQLNGALGPVKWGTGGWESFDQLEAQRYYDELARLSAAKARAKIVDQLKESGDLIGEPRPITHPVKFFEKGDRPLEIITSRQWFIRTMDIREELLERGRNLEWHPAYMRARYEDWVNGLNGDWCVSRQRFFGVPFPLWYPIDADGRVQYDRPIADGRSAAHRSLKRCSGRVSSRTARPARRLHRRSGRHGYVGHVVADAADRVRVAGRSGPLRAYVSRWICGRRATTSSARGSSRRSCGHTSSTTRYRGGTRRSPDSSPIPTARRCRSPRGTWSRPWRFWRNMGRTAFGTGRQAGARAPIPPLTRTRCASDGAWPSRF